MIHLKEVRLRRGNKTLLEGADLLIHAREKVGLIGHNGVGKTSLFLMLQNQIHPDQGEFFLPKQLRMQCLRQDMPCSTDPALDYTCNGDLQYRDLMQALQEAEIMHDGFKISDIHEALAHIDGYRVPASAAKILLGLGFTQGDLSRPVNDFSGGWRMRLNLAQLLISRSDLFLLDEPTNHLDLEAILWLESWLKTCNQTLVIISHDRDFLDQICDRIVHVDNQNLKKYTGNYSAFERLRAEQLANQQANYEKQQQVKMHLTSFVARFSAGTRAKQAQSRAKQLEKMQWAAPVHASNPFQFDFKPAPPTGDPMIVLRDLTVGYQDVPILSKINLSIRRQDRIALVGPNGAGKSTFVKSLAGELQIISGEWIKDPKVKIGYFAQHQLEYLNLSETPLWHLESIAGQIHTTQARSFLGRFNFSEDQVFQPIHSFSGGEKARLALALIVWQQPNLLLLDEPTNHLDLDMREALNLALQSYEGAMILISHDRHLLRSVADQIWLVSEGKVEFFDQDLDAYQTWLLAFREKQMAMIMQENRSSSAKKEPVKKEEAPISKLTDKEFSSLEKQLIKLEEGIKKNDEALIVLSQAAQYDAAKAESLSCERETLLEKIAAIEKRLLNL